MEVIHFTHPGSWGMTDMALHAWWQYMHQDIITKTAECNACVKIGKNLKSIIPSSKWAPLKLGKVSSAEIQIDLVYFLVCIDRFSKFPTAEIFGMADVENVLTFLQEYVLLHGIARTIRLDQAQ